MLDRILKSMFPDIDLENECQLQIDQNGAQYIAAWNRKEPMPTSDEIYQAARSALRVTATEAVNAERNRREQAGFLYLDRTIDSDPIAVQRITIAASVAQMAIATGVPFELEWTCADNSLLTLDARGIVGMMQALGAYGLALHLHARALKQQIGISDDPKSIDVLSGWPE